LNGRIIVELIVITVAAVILLVVLGTRYVSAPAGPSGAGASPAASSGSLTLLFLLVLGAVVIFEAASRMREKRSHR
jgi:hypothetical protein